MADRSIGVFSGQSDIVHTLRQRCPAQRFADDPATRDLCRVIVVDSDSHALLESPPRKSLVRIVLRGDGGAPQRRVGEIRVGRAAFLDDPGDVVEFAVDLAEAVMHAAQLEQEVGYLTQIHELMSMTDAEAVSERVTRSTLNLLGVSRGTLFLHDPRLERYVASFSNDPSYRETEEFLPGVPPDLLQRALASGSFFAVERKGDGGGLAVMPLQVDDDLIGVIRVPLGKDDRIEDDAVVSVTRYLAAVVQVLGKIYQLTRSRDLAMRDDLTKAFNRRFFDANLDEEMERARRYGALFSVIFLDLDDLKTINNAHGHLTGSRVLQEVAKRILNAVRGIDKVVRFGGDEFCIILPQTDQEQAVAVANRIRKSMTASVFRLEGGLDVSITASFGIATYPTHAITKEDLIRQADAAMYRVKSTTKNAVGIATVEDATRPVASE